MLALSRFLRTKVHPHVGVLCCVALYCAVPSVQQQIFFLRNTQSGDAVAAYSILLTVRHLVFESCDGEKSSADEREEAKNTTGAVDGFSEVHVWLLVVTQRQIAHHAYSRGCCCWYCRHHYGPLFPNGTQLMTSRSNNGQKREFPTVEGTSHTYTPLNLLLHRCMDSIFHRPISVI